MTTTTGGPKRFLFVTWDGGGNTPPELCVARGLLARGHQVRFLCDPTQRAEVLAAGCEHSAWTTAPHRTTRDRSGDIIRDYEAGNPLRMIKKYMEGFLGGPAPRWAADTLSEIEAFHPDLLVTDLYLPAPLIAGEKAGLPMASLLPNIWIVPTPGIPPMGPGLPLAGGPLGRLRDAVLRALVDRAFSLAVPHLNGARAAYGLPAMSRFKDHMLRANEVLVLTSPVFDFTSPAMPGHVRYVGPQLDDPTWTKPWQSPWRQGDDRPLVLVGLSSTFQDQVPLLRRIVEALSALPVRAVVTLGEAIAKGEVPGTENVHVTPSAPHGPLMQEAAALVTHCGHGTTMKGLIAGVPLVCLPMGRDQNDTAARVVHHGAGIRLKPHAAASKIRRAVEDVLHDPRYRESAGRLGRAIAAGEGCVDAVASLERLAGGANGRREAA